MPHITKEQIIENKNQRALEHPVHPRTQTETPEERRLRIENKIKNKIPSFKEDNDQVDPCLGNTLDCRRKSGTRHRQQPPYTP